LLAAAEAVLPEQFVDGFVVCWKRRVVGGFYHSFAGAFLVSFCSLAVFPCFKLETKIAFSALQEPKTDF
jgi:hypothetical protein